MAETNFQKLRGVLDELFMLDRADLDFGIYRIMNVKREEITSFLDNDLLPQVFDALAAVDSAGRAQVKLELDEESAAFETYRLLAQGSKTGRVQAGLKSLNEGDPGPMEKVGGSYVALAANSVRRLLTSGLSKEAKEELGQLMLTPIKDLPPEVIRRIEKGVLNKFSQGKHGEVSVFFRQFREGANMAPLTAGSIAVPAAVNQ